MSARAGCLGMLLQVFGRRPVDAGLPYRVGDRFLSPGELKFFRALVAAAGERAVVCPKVNLADVFYVPRSKGSRGHMNRIARKHVDFLLCDPVTMRPRLGVELDDESHQREDHQDRRLLVNEVFRAAGLPLIHVPARASYFVGELSDTLTRELDTPLARAPGAPPPAPTPAPTGSPPICRQCGVPMVLRHGTRGGRHHQPFYGCTNFPTCRETQPVTAIGVE